MDFDPEKWKQITDQWDSEDADGLASDKDAMDLADPKTWAEQDGLARDKAQLLKAFGAAGKAPSESTPADAPQAPTRLRADVPDVPATAGAGQKDGAHVPPPVKPAALSDPTSLDWQGLSDRLRAAEASKATAQGYESMFANIGAQSGYKPNEHAGEAEVALAKQPLELAKERQGLEHGALANKTASAAIGVKAAMDDPNSLQSQKAREAIQGMGLPLPKGFDNFSASDIHNFVKTGELVKLQGDQANERDRAAKAAAGDAQKAGALADRKRTMLSLYPENANEISALNDLGDAQTLQTALEGRAGRSATQEHSDQAAATASARELQKQKDLEEWKSTHRPPTADQTSQLEGIEKSDAAVDTFEKAMKSTGTAGGKIAAAFPKAAGALGATGADFQSVREGTAIALARGLEGGMARPGNVEIITKMLPEASDSDEVKATKLSHVRQFIANNREAFRRATQQAGTLIHPAAGGKVKVSNGKESLMIDPSDADAAAADGYKKVAP